MLLLGFILFLGTLTRNVHYGALFGIIVVFLVWKKWKSAIALTASFGIFYGIFEIIKRLAWGFDQVQFSSQGQLMLYKNPYNAQDGMEDFAGFIDRFIENSNIYISKCVYFISGLRAEESPLNGMLTILTYILLIGALIMVFKKNKTIQFTIFYIASLCSVTFIGLQVMWGQWRLIAVFYPYILIALLAFFYYGLKKYKKLQFIYPVLIVCLFFAIFSDTVAKVNKNLPVIQKNLDGDIFADYSPDWKNFMEMSQWAAKNVPEEYTISSRKPEMSFIYTGRTFYGIYSVSEVSLDDLKAKVKDGDTRFGVEVQAVMGVPFYESFCGSLIGVVQASDNTTTGIYQMEPSKAAIIIDNLKKTGVTPDLTPIPTLESKIGQGVKVNCLDPDLLVKILKDNKARYMILPSLRLNPAVNDGRILSTMHRYLTWIQLKYPNSIRLVHTVGASEPSQLVVFDLENMH